jgi:hypothetical protein
MRSYLRLDLVLLQSKIHSFAKFFFCILEKESLAGQDLLGKRVYLLCKKGFTFKTIYANILGEL